MSNQPVITVITPTLNQGQFLEQTLCSVLDQGYDHLQYIVVDGGSNDATLHILERYSDHLTYFSHETDQPGAAINAALSQARGDLVGILSSDDLYLPGALETVAQTWISAGRPGWLAGHCEKIGLCDQPLGEQRAAAPSSLAAFLRHDEGYFPLAGSFFHLDMLRRVGGMAEDLGTAFDYELASRLLADGHTPHIVGEFLGGVREHPSSRTATCPLTEGLAYIEAAERYADRLPMRERYSLWVNCDERRRIYALAEAEDATDERRMLWQKLLRHPWWLADDHYRRALLSGTHQAMRDRPAPTPAA
jgi:glycosyltransferase involved in cell wall biosynthesis